MSLTNQWSRRTVLLAVALLPFLLVGCRGRSAAQAGKVVQKALSQEGKGVQAVERAYVKKENGLLKVAGDIGNEAAKTAISEYLKPEQPSPSSTPKLSPPSANPRPSNPSYRS